MNGGEKGLATGEGRQCGRRMLLPGKRRGSVVVPSSKSIAHRELIAAALSGVEPPVIRGESNDTCATRECLRAMMAGERVWRCGESGTTLRLLEPIAGVMGWRGDFRCEGRLAARPRMPFERRTRYVIAGNVSSQFVSGLLMALPLAGWDSEIAIDGELQSLGYVHLTEDVLRAAGIAFERLSDACAWRVPGGQRYRIAGGREVEGDWSQAAFFLAMGVEVRGLRADSRQGDRAAAGLMAALADESRTDELTISAAMIPDLVPALAARAAFRRGRTRFVEGARLRLKESDRLESTAAMIRAVGGQVTVEGDELTVWSDGRPLAGGLVKTCGDHRIAMSAAVLATGSSGPVEVDDAGVVAKSYPGFWRDFDSLVVD